MIRALLRHRWAKVAVGLLVAAAALVEVGVGGSRVHVRWRDGLSAVDRAALEARYALRNGRPADPAGPTWRYELRDGSADNIRALLGDASVADTAYIDRATLSAVEPSTVRVRIRHPFSDLFAHPSELLQLHRSAWLLLAGGVLFWASSGTRRRRVSATVVVLLAVGALGLALPYEASFVTMGGSADHARTRADFESWFTGRVRFEKHLTQVALWRYYERLPPTPEAPAQAMLAVSRGATAWFILSALAVAAVERWSPLVLRYLGLVLLAPSALLYFGWREFGYLALSVAAYPMLARGLRQPTLRLEAGSVLTGLGAALHGVGLVAMAGAWLTAIGATGRLMERAGRALRVLAWGTAAYLGWIAIYVIIFKLSISPDPGPVEVAGWRPWFADEERLGRISAAIVSPTGARDILMSAWITGVPLIGIAASLWRAFPQEVRSAFWYLPPSIAFLILRWPFEGIGGGMDLVVAGFPALYALAWVCAHNPRRALLAAAFLASAHYAFWRVLLDDRFIP